MYYSHKNDNGNYMQDNNFTSVILAQKGLNINSNEWTWVINWNNCTLVDNKLPPDKQYEVAEWCEENLQGDWLVGIHSSAFSLDIDYIAFKLRWS